MEKVNIIAQDIDQFKKIDDMLNKLPENVRCQIKTAKLGIVGLECIFKYNHNKIETIYLPNKVTQIRDFETFIGIYCGDYFFKICEDLYKKSKYNYIFVECDNL